MLTVRIQEKNYSESIMVLKLKDGPGLSRIHLLLHLRENKENLHNFYGNF